jgi:hypothetical protein
MQRQRIKGLLKLHALVSINGPYCDLLSRHVSHFRQCNYYGPTAGVIEIDM